MDLVQNGMLEKNHAGRSTSVVEGLTRGDEEGLRAARAAAVNTGLIEIAEASGSTRKGQK